MALERANLICELARAAGFERVGMTPAGPVGRAEYARRWLDAGLAGEMAYLERWRELRLNLGSLLPGARSVIVVAHVYGHGEGSRVGVQGSGGGAAGQGDKETGRQGDGGTERWREGEKEGFEEGRYGVWSLDRGSADLPATTAPGARIAAADPSPIVPRPSPLAVQSAIRDPHATIGKVAQYAWGRDYHGVMREKLRTVVCEMRRAIAEPFEARICVDTAPILEREAAAAAGIGWIGKNTMVLHPELGSFFFLGEIVTTLELSPSLPAADHCGTCTRCLEACPTQALIAPYQMDARRCISYLTIEHRGEIAPELQPLMGDWLYGCDICQDVCPHNRKAPATRESGYEPAGNPLVPAAELDRVFAMAQEDYEQAVSDSAMSRASLGMLQRNASIVGANHGASRREK